MFQIKSKKKQSKKKNTQNHPLPKKGDLGQLQE